MIKRHQKSRPARPLFAAAPHSATSKNGDAADFVGHVGWTPERRARFCEVLGECGVVRRAAEAVGMSQDAAYDLRWRDGDFAQSWDAARLISRQVLIDDAMSMAFDGRLTKVYKDGNLVGERLHQSASIVFGVVKQVRSKALLGTARVMAAAQDFHRCMALLGAGFAFPDPENPDPVKEAESLPVLSAPAGWMAADQVTFCLALARSGLVDKACKAVGKSRSSAYAARHEADGAAFAIAWDAALYCATDILISVAMELTDKGAISITARQGKEPVYKRDICPNGRAKAGAWLRKILIPKDNRTPRERERELGRTLDRIESGEAQREIEAADAEMAAEKAQTRAGVRV